MKKIIVTGGTGYIGSHTTIELINAGYEVHIIDNLSNSDISMLDRIEIITGTRPEFSNIDLRDKKDVIDFFNNAKDIFGIIHFAALKSVGESVHVPLKYYNNNVLGLINLLEAAGINEIEKLVFSSSCTVYGTPDQLPVTENTPMGHTPSPYGATKQMCERVIEDFTYSNKWLSAISLRYFNPIGAHESNTIGEFPSGIPNNLMPYITQTAVGIREFLSVFGSDYNTPDGTAVRDYIHVVDLALAHVKSMDYLASHDSISHTKINVGTGKGSSVLDVIKSFERVSGLNLPHKLVDRREGDVECIYADVTLSNKMLDWKAERNLDDMTSSAWKWEQKLRS